MATMRTLFGYFRSSAAYRVRIALALKGLDYAYEAINLKPGVTEQRSEAYLKLNPQGRVPYFVDGDVRISQSPAIIEYLEEAYPDVALLPKSAGDRAYVRQLANIVACDIHPLNNLSVLMWLKADLGADENSVQKWYAHWVREGFGALESMLKNDRRTGIFCVGETPGLADLYLVPQIWNARRFNVPLDEFPTLLRIDAACNDLEAFKAAAPENQPDTPAN